MLSLLCPHWLPGLCGLGRPWLPGAAERRWRGLHWLGSCTHGPCPGQHCVQTILPVVRHPMRTVAAWLRSYCCRQSGPCCGLADAPLRSAWR